LIISAAAREIKSRTIEPIRTTYAPPDLWNRRQDTGKSAADIFREQGIMLMKSKNDRVTGWYSVKEWLQVRESVDEQTGQPVKTSRMRIAKNCENLIRTLPQLQHDDDDPNDCATEPHELIHAPDALRYLRSLRTAPSVKPVPPPRDDFNRERFNEPALGGEIDQSYAGW